MIIVTSILWVWKTQMSGRWYFFSIPEQDSRALREAAFAGPRGFGSVRVEASLGDVSWRTSVFPQKSGGYILPVKKEVRCRTGISAGDEATIRLEPLGP